MSGDVPATGEGRVACSTSSVLLRRVRTAHGEQAVHDVLRRAGVEQDPAWFDDLGNWMTYEDSLALFDAAVQVTGDDQLARRVGEDTVRQHAGTPVATLFRGLGSPQAVYEQLSIAAGKFTTVTELHPEEVAPGRASVVARARRGYERDRNMCLLLCGMLTQPTALFGLPPATVEHAECELHGDPHCRYVVTWDAGRAADAADPEKLVVALEAQIAAMTERLESMYATARDLIALDDLDVALERITHRAAGAVRAPSYLLAVRTADDETPRVHQRGLSAEDGVRAAHALLEDATPASDGSRIVADIASATRHYGRIMAASPGGGFFQHERDLLQVYGGYAAAVLDTHAALAAARASERQSRALLELAQTLGDASTSAEAAQRLVDVVPSVVDCDRVSVFLWDDADGTLGYAAATELPGEIREDVLGLRIRATDTPILHRLVTAADPEPLFFDADGTDPFVAGLMSLTAAKALVVAPIVAQDRFYGVLTVSAADRPDRLAAREGLRVLMVGVVAQAAIALDNARLLETLAHQARHDNLTGLPGHRAFHETLGTYRGEDGATSLTLAAIDIDDFKTINDTQGHPVGDEALRLVGDALRGALRDGDTVFRVGGEEFAALLPGLTAADARPVADRLRLAVAAASFVLPLRISIGLASSDGETDMHDLVDRADAALYAAKRGGKNRVALAN